MPTSKQEIRKEPVNTNNGWGFGGWVGNKIYYSDGSFAEIGRNCHRHTGTSAHNEYWLKTDKGFKNVTKKEFYNETTI